MLEYKYNKSENKFTENGHTMFEEDVLQKLKRLSQLEEKLRWIPVLESTPPKNIQLEIKTDGKYISTTEFQCINVLDRCTEIHATHWRHIL